MFCQSVSQSVFDCVLSVSQFSGVPPSGGYASRHIPPRGTYILLAGSARGVREVLRCLPAYRGRRLTHGSSREVAGPDFNVRSLWALLNVRARVCTGELPKCGRALPNGYVSYKGAPPRNGCLSDSAEIEGLLSTSPNSGMAQNRPLSPLVLDFL